MVRCALGVLIAVALGACGPSAPPPTATIAETATPVREAPPAHVDYVAPLQVGEVPEASRGAGDCALLLRLRDADDGSPVAMYARLWRLGVADDGAWTAGDHVQARLTVGADGARIEHLPAGRYRVEVPDQRRPADDPPEFTVGAGSTERVLDVRPRRTHHLRLRIYDADGASMRHVTGEIAHDDGALADPPAAPAWADPRFPCDEPSRSDPPRPGRPSACFFRRRVLPPLDGGPDGFDLGVLRDASRGEAPCVTAEIQCDGRNDVAAFAAASELDGPEAALVAVCVPHERLTANVERPDGTPLPPESVRVSFAACRAVHGAPDPSADRWRTVRVRVVVTVAGFEDLTYDWSVATADEPHALVEPRPK